MSTDRDRYAVDLIVEDRYKSGQENTNEAKQLIAKVPDNDRELLFWIPSYRKVGDELANFVNLLGVRWGNYYAEKIGQDVPSFQTEDDRVTAVMRNFRYPRSK